MDEETFEQTCRRLEHWETPRWAADAILAKEIMTDRVVDPCCGTGVLANAASDRGYEVDAYDIEDWGFHPRTERGIRFRQLDWLKHEHLAPNSTIFCNPPFSLAAQFVGHAFDLGARKVICFQRHAFWESRKRVDFWAKYPPNRIYICGDRADCWLHSVPAEERTSSTPTAHSWFVFERGQPAGTLLGHIRKSDAA